ncbi:MAG: hypothetical protein C0623_00060 [Desulfuromonas sp.]|nr:MAG: hypothetical protein C0623_00060 [Desulfuromonas sp.]
MNRILISFLITCPLLFGGCASHIPPELELAETAVSNAYFSGAGRIAPEQYRAAQKDLEKGRELVDAGDDSAHLALLDAIIKSHAAEIEAYRHQIEATEEQLDSAEEYILKLEIQRSKYFEVLGTIYDEQKLSEIRANGDNDGYKPASNYRVRRGENLFAIAARRKVYGDALLWPLIYKANRDQIKDPQQIYPGQVLTIPRDVSEEEKDEARATARESKIFQQPAKGSSKK